jgi:type II secretion system protein N
MAERRRGWGPFWIIIPAALCAGLAFAAFVVASFPYDETISTMLAPYQLRLEYQQQHLRLPFGARLEGVNLVSTGTAPNHLLLQSAAIDVAPTLAALFLGRPAVRLSAQLYGGTVHATLVREAGAITVNFRARAVSLTASQPLRQFNASIGGTLSAAGSAQINGADLAENRGSATVDGRDVSVEITQGFPWIHLGAVSGKLVLENAIVRFADVETRGGDVLSKADGEIQLLSDLADSPLVAKVYLAPTASGRAHFGLFFNMLPHPPSEGPYYVRGPLGSPSIS